MWQIKEYSDIWSITKQRKIASWADSMLEINHCMIRSRKLKIIDFFTRGEMMINLGKNDKTLCIYVIIIARIVMITISSKWQHIYVINNYDNYDNNINNSNSNNNYNNYYYENNSNSNKKNDNICNNNGNNSKNSATINKEK